MSSHKKFHTYSGDSSSSIAFSMRSKSSISWFASFPRKWQYVRPSFMTRSLLSLFRSFVCTKPNVKVWTCKTLLEQDRQWCHWCVLMHQCLTFFLFLIYYTQLISPYFALFWAVWRKHYGQMDEHSLLWNSRMHLKITSYHSKNIS